MTTEYKNYKIVQKIQGLKLSSSNQYPLLNCSNGMDQKFESMDIYDNTNSSFFMWLIYLTAIVL